MSHSSPGSASSASTPLLDSNLPLIISKKKFCCCSKSVVLTGIGRDFLSVKMNLSFSIKSEKEMISLKIQYGDLKVKLFCEERKYILKYKLLSEGKEKYRSFDPVRPFVFIPDISALRHVSTVSAVFYSGKECKGFIMQPVPVEIGPVSVGLSYDGSAPMIRSRRVRSPASENTVISGLTQPFWEVLARVSEETPRPRKMTISSFRREMAKAEGVPLGDVLAK